MQVNGAGHTVVEIGPMLSVETIESNFNGLETRSAANVFVSCASWILDTLPSCEALLYSKIKHKEFSQVVQLARQLKANFLATGSPFLANLCARIEEEAKVNRMRDCELTFAELSTYFRTFAHDLQNLISLIEVH